MYWDTSEDFRERGISKKFQRFSITHKVRSRPTCSWLSSSICLCLRLARYQIQFMYQDLILLEWPEYFWEILFTRMLQFFPFELRTLSYSYSGTYRHTVPAYVIESLVYSMFLFSITDLFSVSLVVSLMMLCYSRDLFI